MFSGQGPTEDEKAWAVEVHRPAADHRGGGGPCPGDRAAQSLRVLLPQHHGGCPGLCARVDRPNFGVLYDTFHANIEEQDPVGCIYAAGDVIRHVHISENDRGTPGKGHIDFAATARALRAVGYDGWLTIEAFGTALPALAAATKVWRDFFPSREEVYEHGLKTMREAWDAAGLRRDRRIDRRQSARYDVQHMCIRGRNRPWLLQRNAWSC